VFELAAPRANELTGMCGPLPSNLECLSGHPAGGAVPADQAKAVTKCAAGVEKAAAKFAVTKLKALEKCIDRVFACLHTKPPGDACATDAEPKCDKDLAKIDVARTKLLASIEKKCGDIPFALLRTADALNLDAMATTCDNVGVAIDSLADYGECVFRQHSCLAEAMMSLQAPLAPLLLDAVNAPPLLGSCN